MKNKLLLPIILVLLVVIGIFVVRQISTSKEEQRANVISTTTEDVEGNDTIDIPVPNISEGQWVSDPDSIIDYLFLQKLNNLLSALHEETTVQAAVVAVNKLDTEDIDSFAIKLFNVWGIGHKDVNNGILIILDKENRACTIRTGLGTEKVLTDSICSYILNNIMIPEFSQSEYGKGIYEGAIAIKDEINNSPNKQLIVSHDCTLSK